MFDTMTSELWETARKWGERYGMSVKDSGWFAFINEFYRRNYQPEDLWAILRYHQFIRGCCRYPRQAISEYLRQTELGHGRRTVSVCFS